MIILFILIGITVIVGIVSYNMPNEEHDKAAEILYWHIINLLGKNPSWIELKKGLENNVNDHLFHSRQVDTLKAHWIMKELPDFWFHAEKSGVDKVILCISGSANGTTQKYFGFSLYVSDPTDFTDCWFLYLTDSFSGDKISRETWCLTRSFKKILPKYGRKAAINVNSELVWQSLK